MDVKRSSKICQISRCGRCYVFFPKLSCTNSKIYEKGRVICIFICFTPLKFTYSSWFSCLCICFSYTLEGYVFKDLNAYSLCYRFCTRTKFPIVACQGASGMFLHPDLILLYLKNEGPDQPAHLFSLNNAFVTPSLESIIHVAKLGTDKLSKY